MIEPWLYEVARQRQRDLVADAERHRLGRRARDRKTHRSIVPYRLTFRPLTDSNRRPPHHLMAQATHGNPGQVIWLVLAHFAAGRFAVDCHWLLLLGSINAP
jgi:hypothetical protein